MYNNATSTSYNKKDLMIIFVLLLLGSGLIGLFSINSSSEIVY